MISRWSWVVLSAVLVTCQAKPPPAVGTCNPEQAQALAARGRSLLDASLDGEHYRFGEFEEAMRVLRAAAASGSRDAQSLYGRTLFGSLFARAAPVESQRDEYVSALAALRRSARAGDEPAQRFLPGWSDDTPDLSAHPLDTMPEAWLHEAIERAEAPDECSDLAAPRHRVLPGRRR